MRIHLQRLISPLLDEKIYGMLKPPTMGSKRTTFGKRREVKSLLFFQQLLAASAKKFSFRDQAVSEIIPQRIRQSLS